MAAGRHRTGKADRINIGVFSNPRPNDRPGTHDQIKHTFRTACLIQNFGQLPGTGRGQFSWFDHHRIAKGQGRGDFPGRDRNRKIPGGDQADNPDRLSFHHHINAGANRGNRITKIAQSLASKEFENLSRSYGLTNRFRQGFAFFTGQQAAELILARHDQRTGFFQHIMPDLRAGVCPGGLSSFRSGNRLINTARIPSGKTADDIVSIGRVYIF